VARLVGEMQDLGGPPKEVMGDMPEGLVSSVRPGRSGELGKMGMSGWDTYGGADECGGAAV
jgi:hypothetical protein